MKQLICSRLLKRLPGLAVVLALLMAPAAHGQNAVRSAATLHQQLLKLDSDMEPIKVLECSQQFFQLLALDKDSTIEQVRNRYKGNAFVGKTIEAVYEKFVATIEANATSKSLKDLAAIAVTVDAPLAQQKWLGFLKTTLWVPKKPIDDTTRTTQVQFTKDTTAFFNLYNATVTPRLSTYWYKDTSTISHTLQEKLRVEFTTLFKGFKEQAEHYKKQHKPKKRDGFDFSLQNSSGTLRSALVVYFSSRSGGASDADNLLNRAKVLYEAVRASYEKGSKLCAAAGEAAVAEEKDKDKKQRLDATTLAALTPTTSTAPSISLPTTSAALTRAPAGPAAVSAEGAIIDGTARFLADRLKQELNATFFQHFATLLHDSAYVELQLLFPSTARLITSGSADYSTIVQTLRGTFERDLRELLFNYGTLLENQEFYKDRLGISPQAKQTLHFTYASSRALYYLTHGAHPADLLARLRQDLERNSILAQSPALDQILGLSDVLSDALTDEQLLSRQWLPTARLDSLLRAPATRELLLGLLLERVQSKWPAQWPADLKRALTDPAHFRSLALDFVVLSGQLQDQAAGLGAQAKKGTLRANDFVPLYQTMQRGLEWAATASDSLTRWKLLPTQTLPQRLAYKAEQLRLLQHRLSQYRGIGDALLQGYVAADAGDYGVTLSNLLDVVLLTLDNKPPLGTTAPTAAEQLPQPARTQLLSLSQIVRYGSFMASVAQAKSSDDVKQALEAAALPVGSASIKRRSFSSISVNAFGGVTTGVEYAFLTSAQRGAGLPDVNSYKFNAGATAPIGLTLNWGLRGYAQDVRLRALEPTADNAHGRWQKRSRAAQVRRLDQAYRYYDSEGKEKFLRGSALGLFVSVIDLGVPVLLRFNDDNATTLPTNIGFRQVLAPGLFGMYHLRGVPLTAFAGAQYTPQLRELNQIKVPNPAPGAPTTFEADARNSIRYNVGITIDIPLFQLYTRTGTRSQSPRRPNVEEKAQQDMRELESMRQLTVLSQPEYNVKVGIDLNNLETQLDALYRRSDIAAFTTEHPESKKALDNLLAKARAALYKQDLRSVVKLRTQMQQVLDQLPAKIAAFTAERERALIRAARRRPAITPPSPPMRPEHKPILQPLSLPAPTPTAP